VAAVVDEEGQWDDDGGDDDMIMHDAPLFMDRYGCITSGWVGLLSGGAQ
jgi:hypothetical protein